MAVYDCPCGLIVSTTSERPQCLRCHRVLEKHASAERLEEHVEAVAAATVGRSRLIIMPAIVKLLNARLAMVEAGHES